jgi:glucokinase
MGFLSLGVDIGGTNTKMVAVDGSRVLARESFKTPVEAGEGAVLEAVLKFFSRNGASALKRRSSSGSAAIGYSTPGIWGLVDGRQTVIGNSFNLPWLVNSALTEDTKKALGINAYGLNDAKLQIYGQCIFGCAGASNVALGLTLGTGVGGAVVMGKKIFLGANGHAGELGHISIDHGHYGRKCNCGNVGCLEAYVGTAGFLRTIKECIDILGPGQLANSERNDIRKIFSLARKEPGINIACISAIKETAVYLAKGLSGMLLAFNPDVIIFDGQIAKDADLFWPFTLSWLKENLSQKQVVDRLRMQTSSDPEYSGALGAAAYAAARERNEQVLISW